MLKIKTEVTAKFTISVNFLPETRQAMHDKIDAALKNALCKEDYESVSLRKVRIKNPTSDVTGKIYVEVSSNLARANMIHRIIEDSIKRSIQDQYVHELENNHLHKGKVNIL